MLAKATLARWMRLTEIPPLLSAIAFLLADASAVLGQLQGGWSTCQPP